MSPEQVALVSDDRLRVLIEVNGVAWVDVFEEMASCHVSYGGQTVDGPLTGENHVEVTFQRLDGKFVPRLPPADPS